MGSSHHLWDHGDRRWEPILRCESIYPTAGTCLYVGASHRWFRELLMGQLFLSHQDETFCEHEGYTWDRIGTWGPRWDCLGTIARSRSILALHPEQGPNCDLSSSISFLISLITALPRALEVNSSPCLVSCVFHKRQPMLNVSVLYQVGWATHESQKWHSY